MDWDEEIELAKDFAIALVTRNGVPNFEAAKTQGEDIANMSFELAKAFKKVQAERTAKQK